MKHIALASTLALAASAACAPVDDGPAESAPLEVISSEIDHAQDAGYVRLRAHSSWYCTGTVVRRDWVLTSGRCLTPSTQPSLLHIDMGGLQTPVVEVVRHPTLGFALLRLASTIPFTPRAVGSASAAALAGAEVRCHGFTAAGRAEGSGNFIVQASAGSLHNLRDARRQPSAVFVADADLGGPCELVNGPRFGPVVGLLHEPKPTCAGGASCAIDGTMARTDGVRLWVDDMIRLSQIRTPSGRFSFRNPHNNQCWDIPDASLDEGAAVNQFPCHFGDNQAFYQSAVAGVGAPYVQIVNARSGKCVEVTAGTSGDRAPLRQASCTGANHQLWQVVNRNSWFTIHPRSEPTRVVDIPNGTWAPAGTRLQLSTFHNGANQQWLRQ